MLKKGLGHFGGAEERGFLSVFSSGRLDDDDDGVRQAEERRKVLFNNPFHLVQ